MLENAVLNMPANLENSAVATGLEKVSFHSNPKKRQCSKAKNAQTTAQLPEDQVLIYHTSGCWLPFSLETWDASRCCLLTLSLHCCGLMMSPRRGLCTCLAFQLLWLPPRGHTLIAYGLMASRTGICGLNRTVANKEALLLWLSPKGSTQRKCMEMPSSQYFPDRSLLVYFKSCWLRFCLWDTDRSWHTLNFQEPLRRKKTSWMFTKVCENQELRPRWTIRLFS